MKLCAIIKNGKILGIALVSDKYQFGDGLGYAHIEVKNYWDSESKIPSEFRFLKPKE